MDRKSTLVQFNLGDNSIVSYVLEQSNNNNLIFRKFNLNVNLNPEAKPLFHSDRCYQNTSAVFTKMQDETRCTHSMSRVARCLDNEPMEGFWSTLKCEMFYLDKFDTYSKLELTIEEYI